MPVYEIIVSNRPDIKAPAFTAAQMRSFGELAIVVQKERIARLVNVLDEPAKPLNPIYAKAKLKKGRSGVRDLLLTGNMLGAIGVTEAEADRALIPVRGITPQKKAYINQNRDPWFGLSPTDERDRMLPRIQAVFGQNVGAIQE